MDEALRELARQLSSEDPDEREAATLELAELDEPEAAPLLSRALEDPSEPVRRWGAYGLARLGLPEHAPALRRALEKEPASSARVQIVFGLACLGERPAAEELARLLLEPALDLRREAAEALLSLPGPDTVRPLLRSLLASAHARGRAWVAGVLHALKDAEALPKWRAALATPESRVDAVLVVPLMGEAQAVRELLRLLAALPRQELTAAQAEGPTLLEALGEALHLSGLEGLLGGARPDEALRADLLVLLGRYPHLVTELLDDILRTLALSTPERLGRELGQLISRQERSERGQLFTTLVPLFPAAALSTLAELKATERAEMLQALVEAARSAAGEAPALVAVCQALRATPYGHYFEDLPLAPAVEQKRLEGAEDEEAEWGEEGEDEEGEDEEAEDEEAEDEEPWSEPVPPEAEAVAQRALAHGGLLLRLALEERFTRTKEPAAKEEILRLQQWMDAEGLFSSLGPSGLELLDAAPGAWTEEDRKAVAWSAEELHVLLWALKQAPLPPLDARAEAASLPGLLPLLKDPQPFLESATRRPAEEVEPERDRWAVLLECARSESVARAIAAEPALAEGDENLQSLLELSVEEGFGLEAVQAERGRAQAALEGVRFWSRHLAGQLQQRGLLAGRPGEGLTFQGKRLPELEEPALATLLALAHARFQALEWLSAGEEVAPEEEDADG